MTTLIIGLGNHGEEFAHTRHNAGFMLVDALAKREHTPWLIEKKLFSEVSEIAHGKERIVLAKPHTLMNRSGHAARALIKHYKPAEIAVMHDDIDIALGALKFSFGKRSAGHKGVESVIRALKTKDFWRLRLGIHPPKAKKKVDAMKLILGKFTRAEERRLVRVIREGIEKLGALIPTINQTD
jgi:PTH1 family peptidyl-tRNA hydrolase